MDSWAWRYTKHGVYSVRSGYFKELQKTKLSKVAGSSRPPSTIWRNLWSAKIKPKIKMFAWKALKGGLPVKKPETEIHFAMNCEESKNLWYLSPLRVDTIEYKVPNLLEWVLCLQKRNYDEKWCNLFWNLLWGLWLRRNAWTFEKRKVEIVGMLQTIPALTLEFYEANKKTKIPRTISQSARAWIPPPEGFYKINTDAAVITEGRMGCGAVMRDSLGDVMVSMCDTMQGNVEVEVMEALAVRRGLEIAIEVGLKNVILETDNIQLYYHLSKRKSDSTSFGLIVQDILWQGSKCLSISYSHVKRNGNTVAHHLAKLSETFNELR
ncbi:hypothetical protein RDABS01_001309, partial [Bienertia sinuspersici]